MQITRWLFIWAMLVFSACRPDANQADQADTMPNQLTVSLAEHLSFDAGELPGNLSFYLDCPSAVNACRFLPENACATGTTHCTFASCPFYVAELHLWF
jgi:hypothetical protein